MPELIFTLEKRSDNGKWYARTRFNGKLVNVYVGTEKEEATEKVNAWLTSHNINGRGIVKESLRDLVHTYLEQIKQREERIKELEQTIATQAKQIAEQARQIQAQNAKSETTKPLSEQATPGQTYWDALRAKLKEKAEKRGGDSALAKWIGINESVIRRFLKGEQKTLTPENQRKVEKALQAG
jgi:Mg2+ and Co2+ transporter CorA